MRKSYPAAMKAKIALLALKEEIPLTQLAAQHEVHPTQIRQWKQVLLDAYRMYLVTAEPAKSPTSRRRKHGCTSKSAGSRWSWTG